MANRNNDTSRAWNDQIKKLMIADGITPTPDPRVIAEVAKRHGVPVPQGFHISTNGLVEDRNIAGDLGKAAAGFGGVLAGGAALGALAGGGAAAGGLGPVAAGGGTTSATVPAGLAAGGTSGASSMLKFLGRYGQDIADVGQIATGAAAGSAAGRREDDRVALASADLNMNAPTTRAQQVARGDAMAADIPQSQRIGSGRDVSFTGGVGPQLFGPDTTMAGNELKRQALAKLMSGEPEFAPASSGVGEKLAGGIGLTGSILGALSRYRGR